MKTLYRLTLCLGIVMAYVFLCGFKNVSHSKGSFDSFTNSKMESFNADTSLYFVFNGDASIFNCHRKEIVSCNIEDAEDFSEGLAAVAQNDKWGFINTQGEIVIPCNYEDAKSFSEGLAKVKQNGKWGLINTKGEEILPVVYHSITLIE